MLGCSSAMLVAYSSSCLSRAVLLTWCADWALCWISPSRTSEVGDTIAAPPRPRSGQPPAGSGPKAPLGRLRHQQQRSVRSRSPVQHRAITSAIRLFRRGHRRASSPRHSAGRFSAVARLARGWHLAVRPYPEQFPRDRLSRHPGCGRFHSYAGAGRRPPARIMPALDRFAGITIKVPRLAMRTNGHV